MGFATALRSMVGFETKSQEVRADDEKAARIWGRLFGLGGDTYANKPVTVDAALQLSTLWACVRLIAETVATLPLTVYRRRADNGREVAADHPLHGILHDAPNDQHTAVEFLEGLVLALCLWGNAYAFKLRSGDRIVGLEPLRSDLMTVYRDSDGELRYRYSERGGTTYFAAEDILHVRGFGAGGDVGLSPVAFARQTLGAAVAAEEASARLFSNGVRPSGILTIDQVLKPDQRKAVKENIVDPLTGSANTGGVFVIEAGMKFQQVSLSPEDAEMLKTRAFNVEEICRWYRVPPVLVGHASAGQTMWGSGVEQIMLGWLTLGLRAYLTRIEQAIRRDCIAPADRRRLYAEFNIEALLRADSAGRAELYSKMAQNGIYTRNEIRARENLSAVEGGDTITVQSNLLPIHLLGQVAQLPRDKPVEPGAATVPPAKD